MFRVELAASVSRIVKVVRIVLEYTEDGECKVFGNCRTYIHVPMHTTSYHRRLESSCICILVQ
jgi:hypothetical protein